jgi:hypothetical protein
VNYQLQKRLKTLRHFCLGTCAYQKYRQFPCPDYLRFMARLLSSNLIGTKYCICKVVSAIALLTFLSTAHAQYQATAYIPSGTVIGQTSKPGDVSYTYNNGETFATASFTSSPIASVNYTTSASSPVHNTSLNGGGMMTYGFTIAAAPFTNVPIDFQGLYSSFQGAAGQLAATSFTIQTVNSSVFTYSTFESFLYGNCGAPTCLQYTTFNNTTYTSNQPDVFSVAGSFQGMLEMLTGADGTVIGSVQLFAGANVAAPLGGGASAAAFIDPHLEINATFLSANPSATLTITPGVGNAISAVPESNTLAMTLAGLGLVGGVAGRRKQKSMTA